VRQFWRAAHRSMMVEHKADTNPWNLGKNWTSYALCSRMTTAFASSDVHRESSSKSLTDASFRMKFRIHRSPS
jgi:hypothetical protein